MLRSNQTGPTTATEASETEVARTDASVARRRPEPPAATEPSAAPDPADPNPPAPPPSRPATDSDAGFGSFG